MENKNQAFKQLYDNNLEKLDLFTTAITRAHGKSHPEAFDVRSQFEKIKENVQSSSDENLDLKADFAELRKITNNYEVPNDVCETYEATYKMLSQLDEAYKA